MEDGYTGEQMDNLIEAWHRHVMSVLALTMNLTTITDHSGYRFGSEEAEVFAANLEAIIETAKVLDGGQSYSRFIEEMTEAMAQVFAADDKPNRNLI